MSCEILSILTIKCALTHTMKTVVHVSKIKYPGGKIVSLSMIYSTTKETHKSLLGAIMEIRIRN